MIEKDFPERRREKRVCDGEGRGRPLKTEKAQGKALGKRGKEDSMGGKGGRGVNISEKGAKSVS